MTQNKLARGPPLGDKKEQIQIYKNLLNQKYGSEKKIIICRKITMI
jgi:hypothetical protein